MKKLIALIGLCAFVSQCNAVHAADAVTKRERNGAPIRDYMQFQERNDPCAYDTDRCKPAPRPRAVAPAPVPQVPVVGTVIGSTFRFAGDLIRAPFEIFRPQQAIAAPQPAAAPPPPRERKRVLRRSG